MRSGWKRLTGSRVAVVLAVLLLFAGYGLRVVNLDQDLPHWGIAEYQPKDEGCYALLAINDWEYGMLNPNDPARTGLEYPMYIQEHMRINILGNLLGIAGFRLFGDNYYGLRMPMVLVVFLNLLAAGWILLALRKQYGNRTVTELWAAVGLLFLWSWHFYFYVSPRTVEPSTMRMLFVQLTMLIWLLSRKRGRWCFFWMGVCVTAAVFLVYITNVFLYLAVGLLLLLIWKTDGFDIAFRNGCAFMVGSAVLYVAAAVYYKTVWDTTPIRNMLASISLYDGVAGYEMIGGGIRGILRAMLKGVLRYFSANFFLYAPILPGLIFLLLPLAARRIGKDRDHTLCFLVAIPAAFLLQTIVSEDYIWRKLLVVSPFALFFIYWGILERRKIGELLGRYRIWSDAVESKWKRLLAKAVLPAHIVCSVGAAAFLVLFHLVVSNDLAKLDFTKADKLWIAAVGYLPLLIWGIWMICSWIWKKPFSMRRTACLLGGTTLLMNIGFLYAHVWREPTFEERDMMISLSEEYGLDGKYVTGDYVMGITLYNDLKPVMDHHENYGSRLTENPEMFLHHYTIDSADMRSYFDNVIFNSLSEYAALQTAVLPGTLQVYGSVRDFGLYQSRPRTDVVRGEIDRYEAEILRIQRELTELDQENEELDWVDLRKRRQELMEELGKTAQYYSDYYGERVGTILTAVYVDTYGDIRGDVCAPVYGRIYGDIYGDVKAPIYGDIYGDIYGNIYESPKGHLYGEIYGRDYRKTAKEKKEKADGVR